MYAIRSYYDRRAAASPRRCRGGSARCRPARTGTAPGADSGRRRAAPSPRGRRITSYNVCYTKLLRARAGDEGRGNRADRGAGARVPRGRAALPPASRAAAARGRNNFV